MNAQPVSRVITESRIRTSAPETATVAVVSGTHGETPQTETPPLLFRSLARVSRSRRLPATMKTEDMSFTTASRLLLSVALKQPAISNRNLQDKQLIR